jgi:predicted double-glycine peptidase
MQEQADKTGRPYKSFLIWMGYLFALIQAACAGSSLESRHVVLHTLKELRDQNVVKQSLDYSCGAAALATLMVYYYGEPTSEAEILDLLKTKLTPEELAGKAQRGFSLFDLKRVAQEKGYQAAGFRLALNQLQQLAAPVIVYLEPRQYRHFAVLRGVRNGMVYLADPARGNLRMRIDQFLDEWQGHIILALGKAGEENIQNYPLLPRQTFVDVPPQFIGFIDFQDQAINVRNLPLR